jgi:type VI protein secretion system component VasK
MASGFGLGIVLIALFGGWSIIHGQQVNKQLCQFADQNRNAIVNILLNVEQNALENAKTPREIDEIASRTNELLALVPPIRCTVGGRPVELQP